MSYIIIPSRRTRQPQGPVRLAAAYADAFAASWGVPYEIVAPTAMTGSPVAYRGPIGQGRTYVSGAYETVTHNRLVSSYTLIALTGATHNTPERHVLDDDNLSTRAFQFRVINFQWQYICFDAGGTPKTIFLSTVNRAGKSDLDVTIARAGGTVIKLDDSACGSTSDTVASVKPLNATMFVGNFKGGTSNPFTDPLIGYVCLPRFLADAEVAEILRQPWGMLFAPDPRRIYFGAGGGAGPSTYNVTYADSKSLTDAISNLVVFGVTYSDTKTLVDTIASNLTAVGGYSESISLSDSDTGDVGAATYTRDVEESITLTDSYTTQLTGVAAQTETIDLQETYTGSGIFGVAVTETISLTDNQVQDSAKLGDVTETISLSDAYSSQLVANSGYSDTIDLQDLYSSQAVLNSEITDSQSLTDAYAATVPGGTGDGTLTPETIDLIADEVMSRLYENPVRRL